MILRNAILALAFLILACFTANAYDEVNLPFQGIKWTHRTTIIPRPLSINVLEIDLNNPAISFFVTPGGSEYDDPDTEVQEEVLSRRTTTFVADYGLQVAINGDFAIPSSKPSYEYQPRAVLGLAVSDGIQYSTDDGWPALTLPKSFQSGTAYIGHAPFLTDVYNAVGGNKMLVENGQPVDPLTWNQIGGALERHPRTSSGLSIDGRRLIIIVIDGRQPELSKGVTLPEMSEYLIEFGVYTGLNHDGGGSSTLVFDSSESPTIINHPSDKNGERIVSNHLGIFSIPMLAFFGDINNDGDVTAHDAFIVVQHISDVITLSPWRQKAADVTGDGTISLIDAVLILQFAVGLITQFPVEIQTGVSILDAKLESEILTEIISELEKIPLNGEQEQVLKQLKRLFYQKTIPDYTTLLPNFPNPFNSETWIPYQLSQDSNVTIRIYDVEGKLVQVIELGHKAAGFYVNRERAIYWDGHTQTGELAASGIYYYTIRTARFTATRKMVLVK